MTDATMYEHMYWQVQETLDRLLGTEEEDGAGAGIVADVELLGQQRDTALAELAQLRTLVDDIYHRHTDSPAGVCPSCGRIGEQSDTDDGLVNWPCPTVQAIERVVGPHAACPTGGA